MIDDIDPPAPRRARAGLSRRMVVLLGGVVVIAVAAVAMGVAAARIVSGPRATSSGDFFSVHLPPGWQPEPSPRSTWHPSDDPDGGNMVLDGPAGRRISISWADTGIGFGLQDQRVEELGRIPLSVGGFAAVIVDDRLTEVDGRVHHEGYLDVRVDNPDRPLDAVVRRVHGRTVSFAAWCHPAGLDDGFSWCLDVLQSWRWESGS